MHRRAGCARCSGGQIEYGMLYQSPAGFTSVGYVVSTSSSPILFRGMPRREPQRHACPSLLLHFCDLALLVTESSHSFAIALAVKAARRAVSARPCTPTAACRIGRHMARHRFAHVCARKSLCMVRLWCVRLRAPRGFGNVGGALLRS